MSSDATLGLDAFCQSLGLGLAYGAESLSQMAASAHEATLPRAATFWPEAALRVPHDEDVFGVFVDIGGDLFGTTLLLFPEKDAASLLRSLAGTLAGSGADAMAQSALE